MRIINVKTYEELSKTAANLIAAELYLKPNAVLGLATGSSPIGTYKELIKKYEAGELDFSKASSINLDEYIGLDGSNDQSYRYFMNHNLFDHVNINKENTHVPCGTAADMAAECARYDKLIADHGGIDVQLLGIGFDGHIGFNEPADDFAVGTHCVALEESTIEANARFFANKDLVPKSAVTMGIGTIMNAKRVILIASGNKKEIVEKSIHGPVTPQVPASILQFHKDVTIIMCEE